MLFHLPNSTGNSRARRCWPRWRRSRARYPRPAILARLRQAGAAHRDADRRPHDHHRRHVGAAGRGRDQDENLRRRSVAAGLNKSTAQPIRPSGGFFVSGGHNDHDLLRPLARCAGERLALAEASIEFGRITGCVSMVLRSGKAQAQEWVVQRGALLAEERDLLCQLGDKAEAAGVNLVLHQKLH